jgi:hypothetical protein
VQGHEELADLLAEAMDLVKIGPAEMDSVARRSFAEKVKLRLQALEERIAATAAARDAHARRAGGQEGGTGSAGGDLEEMGGGGRGRGGGVDMREAEELVEELERLKQDAERQHEYLRQIDAVEEHYDTAPAPELVPVPGGFVLPPTFPQDRETPFVIDTKAGIETKSNGMENKGTDAEGSRLPAARRSEPASAML